MQERFGRDQHGSMRLFKGVRRLVRSRSNTRRMNHGAGSDRRTLKFRAGAAAAAMTFGLVPAVTAGLVFTTATPADAKYATGGTGLYKGSIDWFDWGTAGSNVAAGTRT